jgi:5'-3' exoribonuclease 2
VIDNLRTSVVETVVPYQESSLCSEREQQSFINDYVFICVLLGNDFVPSLSFLKIKDGAVDILLQAYHETCINSPIIEQDQHTGMYRVNMQSLEGFISYLKDQEDDLMAGVVGHFNAIIPRPPRNFINCVNIIKQQNKHFSLREAQEKAVREFGVDYEEYPLRNKPNYTREIDPKNDPKWRASYYYHVFGDNSPETIKRSCENYIEGLLWVVNYYYNLKACQEWYCHLHYAPTVHDIRNFMFTMNTDYVNAKLTALLKTVYEETEHPDRSSLQLLLVLPPQSIHLIPKHFQPIIHDIQHGCVHFYPHDFRVMTYLKHKLWECSPIIPHVDINKIKRSMKEITKHAC